MKASLWWIPSARIRELSASDLAVLRMCRMITVFLLVATIYFVAILSGIGVRSERDRLRLQIQSCGCAESPGQGMK